MKNEKHFAVKQALEGMDKKKAVKVILQMASLREGNMAWLETKLLGPEKLPDSVEHYKKEILKGFCNNRGGQGVNLSVARKAISDFRKASDDKEGLIDLMIFYVERGTDFTLEYGDLYESFYTSMETMYLNLIRLLNKWNDKILMDKFRPRFLELVKKTEGMGWGYHDSLSDMYDVLGKPEGERKYYGSL